MIIDKNMKNVFNPVFPSYTSCEARPIGGASLAGD